MLPSHIQHRLQGIEGRMAHVKALASSIEMRFQIEAEKSSPQRLIRAMEIAAKAVAPFIRKVILRHYHQAGLGTHTKKRSYQHTGWLKKAINEIQVSLVARVYDSSTKILPTLRIAFPNTMNHVAAASLNWGAVYTPKSLRTLLDLPTRKILGASVRPVVGRAAKRSLKKFAFTGMISKRARGRIEGGSQFFGTQVTEGARIHKQPRGKIGEQRIEVGQNLKVQIPYPWFYFNQQDIGAITVGFEKAMKKELGYGSD